MRCPVRVMVLLSIASSAATVSAQVSTSAMEAQYLYVGDLSVDGRPFNGDAEVKAVLVAEGRAVWSSDGSSTDGQEPRRGTDITVHDGVMSFALGRHGMSPIPLELTDILRSPSTVLRLWVSTGGPFQMLPDYAVSGLVLSESPAARSGSLLSPTAPTLQDVYANSIAQHPIQQAILSVLSGKPVTLLGAGTTPGMKFSAGASGHAATYIGKTAFGQDQTPVSVVSVLDTPGATAFPSGWGDFSLVNQLGQGLTMEVDEPGLSGTTRVWTKGAPTGSEKLVFTSGSGGDVDALVVKGGAVGVGLQRGEDPGADLHIRHVAPGEECSLSIQNSARHFKLGALPSSRLQLRDANSGGICFEVAPGEMTLNGAGGTGAELAIHSSDPNADVELIASGQRWSLTNSSNDGNFVIWNVNTGAWGLRVDDSTNHTRVRVLEIVGGADLAEPFGSESRDLLPGTVVVLDAERPGSVRPSSSEYDRRVAGVVSGGGGLKAGLTLSAEEGADGVHVALAGRVYTLCDASNGAIEPGDLLTTAGRAGHAMRVTDHSRAAGATIGKAMSRLEAGRGLVLVLVSLQ